MWGKILASNVCLAITVICVYASHLLFGIILVAYLDDVNLGDVVYWGFFLTAFVVLAVIFVLLKQDFSRKE